VTWCQYKPIFPYKRRKAEQKEDKCHCSETGLKLPILIFEGPEKLCALRYTYGQNTRILIFIDRPWTYFVMELLGL
jgi:hypothetical protein